MITGLCSVVYWPNALSADSPDLQGYIRDWLFCGLFLNTSFLCQRMNSCADVSK